MRDQAIKIFCVALLILFGVIAGRLAWLMLAESDDLAAKAEQQQTRRLDYYQYCRGDILDRNGRPLVNVEENCAVVFPAMVEDRQEAAAALAEILGQEQDAVKERLAAGSGSGMTPYILKTGLSAGQARQLIDADIPGLMCLTLSSRYPSSGLAAHLLGYVAKGDQGWQGVSGLELRYDNFLRQRVDRQVLAYVDATGGLSADTLYVQEAEYPSYNALRLTLDLDYQQIAEQAFREAGLSGACVIMDPGDGDVLAAVSAPAFDPYDWAEAEGDVYVNKIFALYPPASTFKTVLAAAALSEQSKLPRSPLTVAVSGETPAEPALAGGADNPEEESGTAEGETAEEQGTDGEEATPGGQDEATEEEAETGTADTGSGGEEQASVPPVQYGPFVCTGEYRVNAEHSVHCLAKEEGHGEVDLATAFAKSCNCYFVALGQILGGDTVKEYAAKLGLNGQALLGYELNEESAEDHVDFNSGVAAEVANASLGELGVRVSPLQEARLMAALCNGGYLVTPRLVQGVYDNRGRTVLEYKSVTPEQVLDTQVAEQLATLLKGAVEQGTGQAARGAYYASGGKTGTGEAGGVWFSGFAPAEQPRWVIAVYVENGTAGGVEAAALFKRIIDDIAVLEGDAEM